MKSFTHNVTTRGPPPSISCFQLHIHNSPSMQTHLILASNADCGCELGHVELQATDLLTELRHSVVHLALQTLHRL